MGKRFLVSSSDESVAEWPPVVIDADDAHAAVRKYLQTAYAKDEIFRDSVLDRSMNMSFSEKFFIATPEDKRLFDQTGDVRTSRETVHERVRAFFREQPELGDRFLRYMDGGPAAELTDEVFEFIAMSDPSGLVALDIDELVHL